MLLLVRISAIICFQSLHFLEDKSEVQGGVSLEIEYGFLDSVTVSSYYWVPGIGKVGLLQNLPGEQKIHAGLPRDSG